MKATVLIDNVSHNALLQEWGLAFWIEYGEKKILLDTGASGGFAENAAALGIDLSEANFGVLSHAHYDHSDGMADFFAANDRAKFYLQKSAREDCWCREGLRRRYIGIKRGTLETYADRIERVDGECSPCEGVWILGHTAPNLAEVGKKVGMFRRDGWRRLPEDFSHEQSLVFETETGLVIFNSCCHAGADVIVNEVRERFPDKQIRAILGGFHLYETPDDEVRAFARRLRDSGVEGVWTGHCTGGRAMEILREELGERAQSLYSGCRIEF